MMRSTIHPIVSWSHGMGLKKESLFIGTRDYSALLSSAAAIKYLQGSAKGIETRNRDSVLRYSKMLREAWGKSHSLFLSLSLSLPSLSPSNKKHRRRHYRYRKSTTRRKCMRCYNGSTPSRSCRERHSGNTGSWCT